jgi:hypothetical protein
MHKVFTAIAASLMFQGAAFAGSIDDLDNKYGFQSYKFGTAPSKHLLSKTTEQLHEPGVDCFILHNVHVAGVPLKVTLFYYKNKLIIVNLDTDKDANETVLRVFRQAYGEPSSSDDLNHNYSWLGNRVALIYKFNIFNKETHITMGEISLVREKSADDEVELEKSSKEDL